MTSPREKGIMMATPRTIVNRDPACSTARTKAVTKAPMPPIPDKNLNMAKPYSPRLPPQKALRRCFDIFLMFCYSHPRHPEAEQVRQASMREFILPDLSEIQPKR